MRYVKSYIRGAGWSGDSVRLVVGIVRLDSQHCTFGFTLKLSIA